MRRFLCWLGFHKDMKRLPIDRTGKNAYRNLFINEKWECPHCERCIVY